MWLVVGADRNQLHSALFVARQLVPLTLCAHAGKQAPVDAVVVAYAWCCWPLFAIMFVCEQPAVNIVTCFTYPEKFIRDTVIAPFLILLVNIVTLPPITWLPHGPSCVVLHVWSVVWLSLDDWSAFVSLSSHHCWQSLSLCNWHVWRLGLVDDHSNAFNPWKQGRSGSVGWCIAAFLAVNELHVHLLCWNDQDVCLDSARCVFWCGVKQQVLYIVTMHRWFDDGSVGESTDWMQLSDTAQLNWIMCYDLLASAWSSVVLNDVSCYEIVIT